MSLSVWLFVTGAIKYGSSAAERWTSVMYRTKAVLLRHVVLRDSVEIDTQIAEWAYSQYSMPANEASIGRKARVRCLFMSCDIQA